MKGLYFNECHFFGIKSQYFIFMVKSLQLFWVDKVTFKKIKQLYDKYGESTCFEHRKTTWINELINIGILIFENSNTSESNYVQSNFKHIEKSIDQEKIILTNIVLQVANDCNLNCKYCYGSGGGYGRKRELMSFDVAQKGIDYLVAHRGNKEHLRVTFFGGEPLMNFELIKQVIAYCKKIEDIYDLKFNYSMTTNGTIVSEEILQYIKEYKIAVMVSIDGGKNTQDRYRCFVEGNGSFDVVQSNVQKFKDAQNGLLSARATVCKPQMDMVKIRQELMDIGFTNVIMSMVDINKDSPLFLGNETEAMINEYSRLSDELIHDAKIGRGINNTFFNEILRKLYYKALTIKGCNAGSTGFAIGSDGLFYPCHRYMGMSDYACGTVDTGIDVSKVSMYKQASVFNKDDCKNCWARFLCGGACSNTCVTQEDDIFKAPKCYCETYKGIYEHALYIYYMLKQWDDNYFRALLDKDKETVATVK